MYCDDGYMFVAIMPARRAPFDAGDLLRGSAEEKAQAAEHTSPTAGGTTSKAIGSSTTWSSGVEVGDAVEVGARVADAILVVERGRADHIERGDRAVPVRRLRRVDLRARAQLGQLRSGRAVR